MSDFYVFKRTHKTDFNIRFLTESVGWQIPSSLYSHRQIVLESFDVGFSVESQATEKCKNAEPLIWLVWQ